MQEEEKLLDVKMRDNLFGAGEPHVSFSMQCAPPNRRSSEI